MTRPPDLPRPGALPDPYTPRRRREDRGRVDVHGMVALILAVGATISVCALAIGAVLQDSVISPQGSALLTTALGTLLGAVSVYLGGTLIRGRGDRERAAERRADRDDPDADR